MPNHFDIVASAGPTRPRLNDRFELKSQAGAGGMGTVYQAIDKRTGALVAVKILSVKNVADVGRFDQEARLLHDLHHPGIVRYVDHGLTSHGDPYIAMEWLEGETLDQRLARGRLAAAGVANLAARVLEALAAAHEHGIVHRDIKPSNVFLADWRLFTPRIIDFGVARLVDNPRRYTRRGATVGTPSYSSPEQARAEPDIDGRADIFSLGCVLFECLTGKPPFHGASAKQVLSQICLEPIPSLAARLRDSDSEVDQQLVALIDEMLVQDRQRRPPSARALAAQFQDIAARLGTAAGNPLGNDDADVSGQPGHPPQGLGFNESRVLAGVLVSFVHSRVRPPARTGHLDFASIGEPAPGLPVEPPPVRRLTSAVGVLLDGREADDAHGPDVRALADDNQLSVEAFAPGSYLLWPRHPGPVSDQVRDLASAAARLRASEPEARLSLAAGRGMVVVGSLLGPLTDRLTELLPELPGAVRLDEPAARLLPPRLVVRGPDGVPWLRAADGDLDQSTVAVLDAREPPLVGRQRDVERLLETLRDCAASESARIILLEGPVGMGKTRLARALVTAAREQHPRASVVFLRARHEDAGRRFALLSPLQSGADQLGAAAPVAARQAALVERLAGMLAQATAVLLVIDDLQWADRSSLAALDLALRELRQRPLLMVGLARPELGEQLPTLFQERSPERLRLLPLSNEAGRLLLRTHLPRPSAEAEQYVFERWEGNPLYLRELAAAFTPGALLAPDTVLGEVEPRLLPLDEEPRRVLRAASLFGEQFEFEAVLSLLGLKGRRALEDVLAILVEADVLRRVGEARGTYAFRHKLVREAAFGMLAPEDRALGMARARQWLEEAGKTIPELLLKASGRRAPAVPLDESPSAPV